MAKKAIKQEIRKSKEPTNIEINQKQVGKRVISSMFRGVSLRMLLMLVSSLATLVAIFIVAVNVISGGNLIYFENIGIPDSLKEVGIHDSYVRSRIIEKINAANDSIPLKLQTIFNNYESSNNISGSLETNKSIKPGENDIEVSGSFINIDINNVTRKMRRNFTNHEDIGLSIYFTIVDKVLTANYSLETWDEDVIVGKISANTDLYKSVADCVDSLLSMVAAHVAGVYSPLAIVLSDFRCPNDVESYEQLNPWSNKLLSVEQKEELLMSEESHPLTRKWKNAVIGNIYENNGFIENNIADLERAVELYKNFDLDIDGKLHESVSQRIDKIENYILTIQRGDNNKIPVLEKLLSGKQSELKDCGQLILVSGSSTVKTKALMYAFDRDEYGRWSIMGGPFDVNLGAKGLADENKKVEGDYRTPTGLFPITKVFGYKNDIRTKMPFIEVGPDHVWVTDSNDSLYNHILEDSWNLYQNRCERLFRNDNLNRYAIVIDYNVSPVVAGMGSAIFIHCERSRNHKTAGCISMQESELKMIIEWLNPEINPMICITK